MDKRIKLTGEEEVALFISNTQHPMKKEIETLCEIIRHSGVEFSEHVKWNAPSFTHYGEDRITLKLNSPKSVDLVFHRGSKVKEMPVNRLIDDSTGLLKWVTNDRAVISFFILDDIHNNKEALMNIVKQWVLATQN